MICFKHPNKSKKNINDEIEDILNLKLCDFGPFPKSIIANLPYNISSKLIINWLKEINFNKDVLK